MDTEVSRILEDAYTNALECLKENRDGLDRVAEALLEEEEISGDKVLELLGVSREEATPEIPELAD